MRIILVICLLFSAFLRGQEEKLIVGEPYSRTRADNFSGFIGSTNLAVYTLDYMYLNRNKQELLVRKFYKGDLKEIEIKDIYSNPYDDFSSDPKELYFQNSKFYLFSVLQGDKVAYDLLRLEIFAESLDQEKDIIIDTLWSDEKIVLVEEAAENGFLICGFDKMAKIKDRFVHLFAIGSNGELEWKETVKSPIALQSFVVEQVVYKKDQPVYLLCNYSLSGNKSLTEEQDRLINNKYTLWAYDRRNDFLKEFELRFSLKWVNGVAMKLNSKNDLVVAGFVNETRNKSVNGCFTVVINNKMKVINTFSNKFDGNQIDRFLSEKEKGKIKEIENLDMRGMYLMSDDSYYLLGEEFEKYTERNYDPRTNITTTTDHFYYHSILVAYFDKNGKNAWIKRIHKEQNSTNDYGFFSSFSTFVKGKEIYLYFNDNERNALNEDENIPTIEDLNENRRFVIAGLKITPDSITRRKMILPKDNSYILHAKKSNQVSEDYFYLQTENRRNARIIAIKPE